MARPRETMRNKLFGAFRGCQTSMLATSEVWPRQYATLPIDLAKDAFVSLECIKGGDVNNDLNGCECSTCTIRAKLRGYIYG